MRYLLFLVLINCMIGVNAQTKTREILYFEKVEQFYNYLNRDSISLNEMIDLFGNYSMEVEEYLFFSFCKGEKCKDEFVKRVNAPDQYSSLLFSEISKIRKFFYYCDKSMINSIIEKSVLHDENSPSSVFIELIFTNGKSVYFYLNKYPDEPLIITNIYLADRESFYDIIMKGS